MARDQPLRMQALDDELTDQNQIIEYNPSDFAKHCHCVMSKEEVMTKFHVGPKTAEKTLQHTRKDGTRHVKFPLSRQYPTGHDHNRYNQLDGDWYADVFFNSAMSTEGHTCALVIYNGEY